MFERSEFLPFSEVKEASRRKKSALNFSLLLSFVSRQKKDDYEKDDLRGNHSIFRLDISC